MSEHMRAISETEAQVRCTFRRQSTTGGTEKTITREAILEELPEAMKVHAALLEELRGLGVIPLIEEITGPIDPLPTALAEPYDPNKPRVPFDEEKFKAWTESPKFQKHAEAVFRRFNSRWPAHIPGPAMRVDGSCHPTFQILMTENNRFQGRPNMAGPEWKPPERKVSVTFRRINC